MVKRGGGSSKPRDNRIMSHNMQAASRHDLEIKIIKRCWQNEAFGKEFTADPVAAFGKYLKLPAASLPKISVHQETAKSWHIVIPEKPANADELSERELEQIAGGGTPVAITVAVTIAGSIGSISAAVDRAVRGKSW